MFVTSILIEVTNILQLWAADTTQDRKSTRLNSSHSQISYAVFCLKKKKKPRRTAHVLTRRDTGMTRHLQDGSTDDSVRLTHIVHCPVFSAADGLAPMTSAV